MTEQRRVVDIASDLIETAKQLSAATTNSEKADLRSRQIELRAEAAAARGPEVESFTDAELDHRLQRCEELLADLHDTHLNIGAIGGASGMGGGLDPHETIVHNQYIDAIGGRRELESVRDSVLAEQQRRKG